MLSQVEDKVQADQYSDSFSDTDSNSDTGDGYWYCDSDTGDRLILIMIVIGCWQ